ncbi:MAG: hypothetical protein QNJ36_14995 [Calothrix sp. MO_167.B42]|nr:hypothetical protein [Calothrix sp. MO_167.B42]
MIFEQYKEEINNYFQSISPELEQKVDRPKEILNEIISWTYSNKYFTKKIFELILEPSEPYIYDGQEEERIENLVQIHLIENWKFKDSSAHLIPIEKAITNSEKSIIILNLYQKILQNHDLPVDNTPEQKELLDSGLIKVKSGKLQVANRIYEEVFNQSWINEKLNIHLSPLENYDDVDDIRASPIARVFAYIFIVILSVSFIGFLLFLILEVSKPKQPSHSTQSLPTQSPDFARNVDECRSLSNEIDEALRKREKRSEVVNKGLKWKNKKKATLNDQCSSFSEYYINELGLNSPDIDNKFNDLLHQRAQDKININQLKEAVDLFCKITNKYEKLEQVKNILQKWESDPEKEKIANQINQLRPDCPAAQ